MQRMVMSGRAKYLKRWSLALMFCLLGASVRAQAPVNDQDAAQINPAETITITPGDGMNMKIIEQITPTYVVMDITTTAHNWFAGTITKLPVGKEVTIGLSMDGKDTNGNKADVSKWKGLKPVMTYGDPAKYETYEWFQKDDQGRWVSGDPFKQDETKFAGTGKTPEQSVVPKELSEHFLSADGKYWQPWREVDKAEALPELNIFRITQKFASPTATIAMRVPYTYTYLQQFIEKLKTAKLPGVSVDEIGTTPGGRKLHVISVAPLGKTVDQSKNLFTVLSYAREHATEPDGSWVIDGMLRSLIVNGPEMTIPRKEALWRFIPILDPDASANAIFKDADIFQDIQPIMPEVISYATWIVNLFDDGYRLDVALNIHNVECNEGQNLSCPFVNSTRKELAFAYNEAVLSEVRRKGFTVGDEQGWASGIMGLRFYGWCFRRFRTCDFAFEVNTRYPQKRLSIMDTCLIGAILVDETHSYSRNTKFIDIRQNIDSFMAQRTIDRQAWWEKKKRDPKRRNTFDLLVKGY